MTANETTNNGNATKAEKPVAKAAPVKANRKARRAAAKAKPGRSSTPMPVISAKAKVEKVELPKMRELAYKASEMKPLDSKSADANIRLLRSTGAKAKRLAHSTACGILLHYVATGDWSKLTMLDMAIGEVFGGAKQRAFRDWVGTFSTVEFDPKTRRVDGKLGSFRDTVKGQGADAKRFTLLAIEGATKDSPVKDQGALNHAFYSGSFGDQPDHTFDFEKAFAAFAQRIQRELNLRNELIEKKQKAKAKKIDIDEKQANAVLNLAKTLHINLESAATAGNA